MDLTSALTVSLASPGVGGSLTRHWIFRAMRSRRWLCTDAVCGRDFYFTPQHCSCKTEHSSFFFFFFFNCVMLRCYCDFRPLLWRKCLTNVEKDEGTGKQLLSQCYDVCNSPPLSETVNMTQIKWFKHF